MQVDGWGRRPLLLGGIGGMVLALLLLGASSSDWGLALLGSTASSSTAASSTGLLDAAVGGGQQAVPAGALVSAGALLLYVGCYQVGLMTSPVLNYLRVFGTPKVGMQAEVDLHEIMPAVSPAAPSNPTHTPHRCNIVCMCTLSGCLWGPGGICVWPSMTDQHE